MRACLLALFAAIAFAAPVPVVQNQWYRLVSGTNSFTIGHSTDASTCSPTTSQIVVRLNSTWTRARVQFQQDYTNSTTTVNSANPATYCFDFTWGGIRVVFQELDGSNNPVGPPSDPLTISVPDTPQTGTITMPQELVGFPGKIKEQVLTIPGSVAGKNHISFQINNYSYNQKGSFSINNGPFTYFESCLWETTLATSINASDHTIVVADGTFLPSSGQILIDNEIIDISGKVADTLTVLNRADYPFNGRGGGQLFTMRPGYYFPGVTTIPAASHTSGARVANFDLQMRYGGVGGGFNTMQFYCPVPNQLVTGANSLRIRLDKAAAGSSGFRVLKNHLLVNGSIAESNTFVDEDPSTWTAPSGGDPVAGEIAWLSASLQDPNLLPVKGTYDSSVSCKDCHSLIGQDLKYFNYSNNAIIVRSQFHRLSTQTGKDIAAYIRTLSVSASVNGRPWNPPYQPGPGLDSRSVFEWSAGAGIDAVLARDRDMFAYLMPPYDGTGVISNANAQTAFSATGSLNPHNLPIAFQFPDWNHWLPKIHPLDAYGSAWTGPNPVAPGQPNGPTAYATVRSTITPGSCSSYASSGLSIWDNLHAAAGLFVVANTLQGWGWNGNFTPQTGTSAQGVASWESVKVWEIMQEYELEGCYQDLFASPATPVTRGWPVFRLTFDNSPNIQHFPITHDLTNSLWNLIDFPWSPQAVIHNYISMVWYFVQMQLNVNNKLQTGQIPIDWGYMAGVLFNTPFMAPGQAGMATWLLISIYQTMHGNSTALGRTPPPEFQGGYNTRVIGQFWCWSGWNNLMFLELSDAEVGSLMTGYLRTLLDWYGTLTASEIYAMDGSSATWVVTKNSFGPLSNPPSAANDAYYNIPVMAYYTGHTAIIDEAIAFAKSTWPGPGGNLTDWDGLITQTCSRAVSGYVLCPSSQ